MSISEPKGALDGVLVLDMTAVVMGPYCTQILSDLGADVIKVESPEGDIAREIGPGKRKGASGLFATLNRGKRSIELDLKRPEAVDALLDLAQNCDLFVHSTRPAAMARLGLSYQRLAKINPRLVYMNLGGFGKNGRYAGQPAYDDVIQGMTGVPLLEARASGNEPRYLANIMADKVSGITAAYAALAALYAQQSSGLGQEVDVSMFETMSAFMLTEHMTGAVFDPPSSEPVYKRLIARERVPFRTADGYIAATIYTNKQVHRFSDLADRSDLKNDPRFVDVAARLTHVSEWCQAVQNILTGKTTTQWLALLNAAEVPAARINSTQDLLQDPHLLEVGFFQSVQHPIDGTMTFPGPSCQFSKTPAAIQGPPPEKGQHTEAVLREFGVPAKLIEQLLMEQQLQGVS
ncbi:CoA transferase [uncultured Shimia sp.]|uniref:CaiB/BaiF CoA transferase family protein n=1 Tax=uncultured Shimia sp. TaxID=573152 RepID=UPI0025F0AD68|nr:CoA transferase [uncultured Shimia sp.]